MALNEDSIKLLASKVNDLVGKDHFTFVYFGDTRGNKNDKPPQINQTILNEILNQVNKLTETPTFILFGGDIAYQGTLYNLNKFREIIRPTSKKIPFFVIPGNHEVYQPNRKDNQFDLANFHQVIGADKFIIKIDIEPFNFQVLAENNVTDLPPEPNNDVHYGFNSQTIDFMERTVKNYSGRSVIALHANPAVSCWGHGMGTQETNEFLNGVVYKHTNKIRLLLTNHIHGYSDFTNKYDQTFVLSGGGGADLAKVPKGSCIKPIYNFVVFRVRNRESSIEVTVYERKNQKVNGQWVISKKLVIPPR